MGVMAEKSPPLKGAVGVGHTRWATCGKPSMGNDHQHSDCKGDIAVVHNGIISNFQELKQRLIKEGHCFTSETDTEVITHLIEKYYVNNLEEVVEKALKDIEGSYAIVVIRADE